jgi:hypothetical protein
MDNPSRNKLMTKEEKEFIEEVMQRDELQRMWCGEYVDWGKVLETALYFYKLGKAEKKQHSL